MTGAPEPDGAGPVLNVGAGGTLVARLRPSGNPEADEQRVQAILDRLTVAGAQALIVVLDETESLEPLEPVTAALAEYLGAEWATRVRRSPRPSQQPIDWQWVSTAALDWLRRAPAGTDPAQTP